MPLPPRVADLAAFDLLLSVAGLGSMGKAAAAHGVSQAAVSARIKTLESALGLTLLERTTRGTTLTRDGALVADWARTAVDAARAMDEGVTALRTRQDARLRVAASLTVAEYLLPRWLIALRGRLPGTGVALTSHNSSDVQDDVLAGRADLGFVEGPRHSPDLDEQIVARDHLTVVVAPGHPWAGRRGVTPARLAATALISRERGSGTREHLDEALDRAGTGAPVEPVLELGSTTAIKNAAADGVAPAVLSSLAVAGELAGGTLVAVPVRGLALDRRLAAIWPRGRPPSGPARELVELAARTGTGRGR
ncbi:MULTISPECIES: LysR family transcriptional regulator [unclassified Pseudonocardia]|uniref:LysR family transcriptional regulator n=1 Tax=unclassified Pseudonocardia TaxID=2619320 RepID=UPI001D03FED9|nr:MULTISPECIES: LysR family transcriptional regulator [unclassified Pseudonocardia]